MCIPLISLSLSTSPSLFPPSLSLRLSLSRSLSLSPSLWCVCAKLYHCILFFRAVRTPTDDGAVALTKPTQVCHWLHHDDVRQQFSPQACEGGIADWLHWLLCCCLLVQLPNLMLCCAARKEFDVRPLVARDSSRKDHRVSLYNMYKVSDTCTLAFRSNLPL